jgi:ABC-type polysaccharide/polyol phosphate transport system ATPase subunit
LPQIILKNLSKTFSLRRRSTGQLKVSLIRLLRRDRSERAEARTVLHDIDLDVAGGECLGLIGANGSGKSTLLRIIAGILPPSQGVATVSGRLVPLLDLGVGFDPELSGRANVFLHASLYGLSRRRTREVYPSIVAFAELAEHMDEPLKTFSSGMQMRLGFAVAAHLQADVLLIDEVLAVGDAHFQAKCLAWLDATRRQGTTIVVVSHDLRLITQLCDRVCLLHEGRIVATGAPGSVVARYQELI